MPLRASLKLCGAAKESDALGQTETQPEVGNMSTKLMAHFRNQNRSGQILRENSDYNSKNRNTNDSKLVALGILFVIVILMGVTTTTTMVIVKRIVVVVSTSTGTLLL